MHKNGVTDHIAHLISDVLEPRLHRLCPSNHRSQFAANGSDLVQRLVTECLPLVRPLKTFLHHGALTASGCAAHYPSLVIEVGQHDKDSSTLRAKSIFNGYFDVIEDNEGGTRSCRIACLNLLGLNALTALYQHDSETIFSLTANGEVVRKSSVRDPFLGSIDHPVFPVFGLDGGGLQAKYIRAGISFRDSLKYKV